LKGGVPKKKKKARCRFGLLREISNEEIVRGNGVNTGQEWEYAPPQMEGIGKNDRSRQDMLREGGEGDWGVPVGAMPIVER